MNQHRAPTIVRATRLLQHVAAGLATIFVVGVVGVVGARMRGPDVPPSRVGASPTRAFPDPPPSSVVPAPAPITPTTTPPAPAVVEPEPEPVVVPRPVVTPPPPPVVVIVQDPTPPVVAPAPEPAPVVLAPQEPLEPPKPAKTTQQHRQRWDTHAQTPRRDHETNTATQDGETGLCAVACVELGDPAGDHPTSP